MQLTITLTDYEARVLSAEYVNIDFLFESQLEAVLTKSKTTSYKRLSSIALTMD